MLHTKAERMLLEYGCGSDVFPIRKGNEYNEIIDLFVMTTKLYNVTMINIAI